MSSSVSESDDFAIAVKRASDAVDSGEIETHQMPEMIRRILVEGGYDVAVDVQIIAVPRTLH